jgi:hypothetical protein
MAVSPGPPPQPPRNLTDAQQDNVLYYLYERVKNIDDTGGYVRQLQDYANLLDDWAQAAYKLMQSRSINVKPPPAHLTFHF